MMFSGTLFQLLLKVITSWQIIVIAVILVLYFLLVSYVARLYHRPRASHFNIKPKKADKTAVEAVTEVSGGDDDLGFEEE